MDPKEGRGNGKFVGNCPLQSASEKRRVEKRRGNCEKEVTAQVDIGGVRGIPIGIAEPQNVSDRG